MTLLTISASDWFTSQMPPPSAQGLRPLTVFCRMMLPLMVGLPALNIEIPPPFALVSTFFSMTLFSIWAAGPPRRLIPPPPTPPLHPDWTLLLIVFPWISGEPEFTEIPVVGLFEIGIS
jgi:hypothetical protein